MSACATLSVAMCFPVFAGPTGGQVTSGNGGITQNGYNTVINQQSQNLAIDWSSFSIGANESVRFNQPNSSAIALNRVLGQSPSEILGNLSANGQVFILNPNGVLFGKGAEVNVGALVASTLNLSDADLQAGNYQFSASGPAGKVVNQGTLTAAPGGYLALLGPQVTNSGSMKVLSGTVLLAAGNKVSLQLNNGSLLSYSIDQGSLDALAENNQLIQAGGGRVFMSAQGADSLSRAVVNNTGVIEAQTVDNHGGVIRLLGDSAGGTVNVGGSLDASAPNGGDGGAIETSAAHVKVADGASISTAAASGKTGSWLVDPTDFTIAASGGDISGTALSNQLASTNVALSTSTQGSGNGDLFVNDAVSWSANTSLTLTAVRNIQINSNITATGNTAGLTLTYGSSGNYSVNSGAKVTLSGSAPSLNIGGVAYTVINSLGVQGDTTGRTLQGMQGNLAGRYALGSDIDASAVSGWTGSGGVKGFTPIASNGSNAPTTLFTGVLAGLGHTISNLTITAQNNNYVGLFGETGSAAIIRDVGLTGGSSGVVSVLGNDFTGALVGYNQGTILNSYSNLGVKDQHYLGGLAGQNSGTISGSNSTGTVTSLNKLAGGLVGLNLAGGTITGSYATGTVTGVNKLIGGLVGENDGQISTSYATGQVGGATAQTGGLVGLNSSNAGITNSYSTGSVSVSSTAKQIGGIAGENDGTISKSYAGGSVAGTTSQAGGLVGFNNSGTVTGSFWDVTATGQSSSAGGGVGMSTAQMKAQADFTSATSANGSANPSWDFSGTWQMYEGMTYPLLKGFLKPVTVSANNISATYTASAWSGQDTYTCSPSCSGLLGTLTFSGASNAINVGNYSITPSGLYSNQQGYAITFAPGTLTITPASLAITGLTASNKVYDGTLTDVLSGTATIKPLGADSNNVSLTGTAIGTFANKNVGNGKVVTVSGYSLTGSAAGNYTLVQPSGLAANITPATLAITGLSATNKVYDTTLTDLLSGTAKITPIGSDIVALSGTGTAVFASKNVGTGKAVTVSGYTLTGTDAGNYTLLQPTGLTANITPASLTVTGISALSKVYDATNTASLSGTATVSALGSDSISVSGSGTGVFGSKNVGTGKAVTVTGYTLSGADSGNYTLVQPTGLTADITAASLTVTGISATSKVYDATTTDSLSGTASVLALGSDNVSVSGTGTGTFATKNVGTGKAVTVTGYTLTGADAGNYTLVQPVGLAANITPASLTVTGVTATNKVYDATTNDPLSGTAKVTGLGSDNISLSGTGTGTLNTKNVGNGRTVTVTGYTLTGTDAANYTLVQPTGLTANITPATLTVTGVSATSKVYDATLGDTLSGTATVTAIGSDSVSVGGTGTGTFGSKNVGNGKAVTVSGYTLSGADASNYTLLQPTGLTANITPFSLTVTGVTATNKVYDATTSDTLSGTAAVLALGSDSVSVGGTGAATFATKNAGTGKAVTVTGYTLSGADSGNYTLVQPTGLTANITPASLTVTGITASNKVYDATLTDTLSGTAKVTAFGSDVVTVSGTGTGLFSTKNVGTGRAVTVSGYTLSGADAGNYTLVQPTGLTANITAASLAVTGISANNKVYDGTTTAALSGTATVTALGSDNVSVLGTGTGTFASKNVGNGKVVTVTGFTLTGADAGNYNVLQPTGVTANITPASLLVTGVTANSKVYDASTTASLSGTATVTGLGSDNVSISGTGSGVFASKNVGNGKTVTVTGYSLSGADSGNYTLVGPVGLTANITPASLLVSGLTANSRVYDSTTVAALSGTGAITPLGSDNVALAGTGTGAFADKNVGSGKAVTVTGYSLTGTDAGNYTLTEPTNLIANITPATLALSGLVASNKVYDGTTTATLLGSGGVTALGSDIVALSGAGTAVFSDKNVGTGKSVTLTGYSLTGADAGNYVLGGSTGSLTANITAAPLVVTGLIANNKIYDASTTALLNGTAKVSALGTDSVSVGGTGSAVFADKNVGSGKAVVVTGYTLSGADAGNYTVVQPTGLTANITPANLVVTGLTATGKVYDASTAATLGGTATITPFASDNVALSGAGVGAFADKNVGTNKTVTVSGLSLTGADAGNYSLVAPATLMASITPATLTLSGLVANNKVYDGNATASLSGSAGVIVLGNDVVAVSGSGTGVFSDKNAGSNKTVTVSGYSLTGADAGNYSLAGPTGLTANISRANLQVTGLTANNKVYDATLTDSLSGIATVAAVSGDNVSLGGSGTAVFTSKNAGNGKKVTVSGYTLSGTDAGNYNLVQPVGLTANITPANLNVSGLSASGKVYDTTTGASLSGAATITPLASDNVALSGAAVGSFADKNVGSNKTVTVSGLSLTGADAGNYNLVEPTNLTAGITAATLTVTGVAANNKVYDATTLGTLSGTARVAAFGSDQVAVTGTGVTTFSDKNVGVDKTVTVSGYSLTGADAGNYTLALPTGLLASISRANLQVTGVTANNKVYDASLTDTLTGTATVKGLGTDSVSVGGTGTAVFNSKNAGNGKTVIVSGYTLTGNDAGNYNVIQPVGLTANITPANLAVGGLSASGKVYDATNGATLTGAATISPLGSDNVALSGAAVGSFADKNVGSNKSVTVSGFSLTGADAGNYNLVEPINLTASITAASLTVTGVAANNKVYDAGTAASLNGTATVAALGSDKVTVTGTATATFGDKNAGNNKAVTVSGYSLSGADAGNYTIAQPTGLNANITPYNLNLTGLTATGKVYDGTVTAGLSGAAAIAVLGNDTVVLSGTGAGAFADKNVGSNKSVVVSGYSLTGADAGNYTLVAPGNLTANITARQLTIGANGSSKVYDGQTNATVSLSDNRVAGDALSLSYSSAAFADANAGTGKAVSVNGILLSGADAGNYTFNNSASTTASITPAALTVTANSIAKVYDGTNFSGGNGVTYTGFVNNETASVLSGNISYVGTSQRATNTGTYTLFPTGLSSNNYAITFAAGALTITPAALTIQANDAAKTYDGIAYSGGNGVTYTGFVANQTPSVLGGTLTYSGSSQGAVDKGSYSITPGGLTARNYAITWVNGTLTISPVTLSAIGNSAIASAALIDGSAVSGSSADALVQ